MRERIPSLSCVVIVGVKSRAGGVLAFEEILDRWMQRLGGRIRNMQRRTRGKQTRQKQTRGKQIRRKQTGRETESGRTGEDLALILCTQGRPAGRREYCFTHNNIRYSEEVFTRELGLTCEDIMFMPAPLNHATGFHHGLITPMLIRARCFSSTAAGRPLI